MPRCTMKHIILIFFLSSGWLLGTFLFAYNLPHIDYEEPTITSQGSDLVSVVIPLYNQIQFLNETIQSVLKQTYSNFEIVIVNDGSTEFFIEDFLATIADLDARIRYFSKSNGGLADARNAGISDSNGMYILPLDADDIIEDTYLEKAMNIFNSDTNVNLVIADLEGFFMDEEPRGKSVQEQRQFSWPIPEWDAKDLLKRNKFHCSAIFKKSVWEVAGGYDPSLPFGWEDWDFWIRVVERGELNPITITEPLFKYRVRSNSMHQFCVKHFDVCYALLQTMHPSSFSFESILEAHETITNNSGLILEGINNKIDVFPYLTKPYLWKGICLEKFYNPRRTWSVQNYLKAIQVQENRTGMVYKDWQPWQRLIILYENHGNLTAKEEYQHFFQEHFQLVQTEHGKFVKQI